MLKVLRDVGSESRTSSLSVTRISPSQKSSPAPVNEMQSGVGTAV